MRRFTAVALLAFGITLPLCAQRGSAHGGFSGHSGGGHAGTAFHGGFRPSAPSRSYRPSPQSSRYGGGMPGVAPHYAAPIPGGYGARQGYPAGRAYRNSPYRSPYRRGYAYGTFPWAVPWVGSYGGWIDPDFGDYPGDYGYDPNYDSGYDNSAVPPDQSYSPYLPYDPGEGFGQDRQQGYVQGFGPGDPDQGARPQYQAFPRPPRPTSVAANQQTITLVFKDHRPNEEIHNYLLNGKTLSVWDQHPREIPIEQLDLDATEKLNRDAGVDFSLPSTAR